VTENYRVQLILIDLPPFETEVLKFICQRSNSLYNQAIYFVRRNHEMTHPGLLPNIPYSVLCSELKDLWNYSMLCAQAAQQTLKSVHEGLDSYKGLMVTVHGGVHHAHKRQSLAKQKLWVLCASKYRT